MYQTAMNQFSAFSKAVLLMVGLVIFSASASAQHSIHTDHHSSSASAAASSVVSEMQDWAKAKLAKSPRHQDWVSVKYGNRNLSAFIVYPEVKKKATAVVVIHEINGLTDWVQSLTDQLAKTIWRTRRHMRRRGYDGRRSSPNYDARATNRKAA